MGDMDALVCGKVNRPVACRARSSRTVKLPFARTGRIWPYSGDAAHPVILYDYTATRERAGPEEFLKGYRGYLQADAYGGYDAVFKNPARGLMEGGGWGACRRYVA